MFNFKNKTIFLISPQSWGTMWVSKHHYANELAKKENTVFFINPPEKKFFLKKKIKKAENIENLYIVTYSYFIYYYLRFHFPFLYNLLMPVKLKRVLRFTKQKPDIVWCFETNLVPDLRIFKNTMKIYHPADNISGKHQLNLIKSSDYVFSVSQIIINRLQNIFRNKDYYFINHGLSNEFIRKPDSKEREKTAISAYFVGNLLIDSLDRKILKKLIKENKNVHFFLIGSYSLSQSNLGAANNEAIEYINVLKQFKNISLLGPLSPENVAKEIQNADVLLVFIDPQKDYNKGSNSHKILEYLSTGKVIISNHVSSYAGKPGLIEMVDEMHNEKLPDLFKKVINNLDYYNSSEKQIKRIEFALDNTYEKQIERIEKIILTDG